MDTKVALNVFKLLLLINDVIPELLTQHLSIERWIHRVSYHTRLVPSLAREKTDKTHLHLQHDLLGLNTRLVLTDEFTHFPPYSYL